MFKRGISAILAMILLLLLLPVGAAAETPGAAAMPALQLWYDQPAANDYDVGWSQQSLPIGNSYLGGSVFGRYDTERITLNEKTFWTGGPSTSRPNYQGGNLPDKGQNGAILRQIQDKFLAGDTAGGAALCKSNLIGQKDGYGGYQLFGNLNLKLDHTNVTDYRRSLDLTNGIAAVTYKSGGTTYAREYFASYPDKVMVVRLTAESGTLGFSLSMDPRNTNMNTSVHGPSNTAERTWTTTGDDTSLVVSGSLNDNQLRFNGTLRVLLTGGGTSVKNGDKLDISGARDVTIVLSMATDYKNDYPTYRTGESQQALDARVKAVVDAAAAKGFAALRAAHTADVSGMMDRVKLDLGQSESEKTTAALLAGYKANTLSPEEKSLLEVLLYQYGRYLLIASSRGDTLPANLQGLWVGDNYSPWASDYHINVNLQMNYWPAYSSNLTECALPLISYVDRMRAPGRVTAKIYGGVESTPENPENGFTAHTQNTPFGWTCPGWSFDWGWSPASVPWILQNVWEHYEYTGDLEFMRQNIYPAMREALKYYVQTMRQVDGKWVSTPAYSPEHGPQTNGNTYEQSLVWQLFHDTLQAARLVGEDAALIQQWEAIFNNLRTPVEIGASGQIKEWYHETTLNSVAGNVSGHRHISHLLGLYPGDLISEETPDLYAAARVSLEDRVDRTTGWGMAQRINSWARLGDGDHAYQVIELLMKNAIYQNLWDFHDPKYFQIDGNFGYTAGVNEMLVQSNMGYLNILPAVPNAWSSGRVDGLLARGNFELDVSWRDGKPERIDILSRNGGEAVVQFRVGDSFELRDASGDPVSYTPVPGKQDRYSFNTQKGQTYTILNRLPMAAPQSLTALRQDAGSVRLSWDAVEGASAYDVYRSLNGGAFELVAAGVPTTGYLDQTALRAGGEVYSYQVCGVDSAGMPGERSVTVAESGLQDHIVDSNDPKVAYTGTWSMFSEPDHYQKTNNCSWTKGSEATLSFTGNGIGLYAVGKPNYNAVEVYIDGVKQGDWHSVNADPKQTDMLVFEKRDLTDGPHTIRVRVMDDVVITKPSVKDVSVSIDYFKVYQQQAAKPVTGLALSSPTGVTTLSTVDQTLQLLAEVTPVDADNPVLSWSIAKTDGTPTTHATVSNSGLVTATGAGAELLRVTAEATDGSGVSATLDLRLATNQTTYTSDNIFFGESFTLDGAEPYSSQYGTSWLTDGFQGSTEESDAQKRFATKDGTAPFTLTVDLGEEKELSELRIFERVDLAWDAAHPNEGNMRIGKVELYVKNDNGVWELYATGCENGGTKINNNVAKYEMDFAPVTAQEYQLKLYHRENAGNGGITLWELEGYHQLPATAADKTELYAALERAALALEDDFGENEWNTFQNARAAAIAAANDPSATQDTVNSATDALNAAMQGKDFTPVLTELKLHAAASALAVGSTTSLTVTAVYDRGAPQDVTAMAQISAKPDGICTVSGGSVTAVGAGTATLTAQYGGKEATLPLRVVVNPTARLLLVVQGGGSVAASPGAPYAPGTEVTLTPTAEPGSRFLGWEYNTTQSTDDPLKLTLADGNNTVTARFGPVSPTPTVTGYTVTPTELSSDGGEITVTLTGTDLTDGIQIKAGTITAQTTGGATNQTARLTLPENKGTQPMAYTVQYSLDGNDWMGSKTVSVQAPTVTPPAPSGGGSSASVGRPSVREDAGQSQAAAEQTHFIDVLRDSWYYSSVYRAHENGLIDGVGGRRFDPDATLTVAQAIKLSAALHQLDRTGEVSLKNGAGNWYDAYVSYAVANGILEERYAGYSREQMNAPVTRGEFVHIFHGALEHYEQLNTVADNALPDVKLGDAFAAAIYELYRAGILHGNDTAGTFRPESTIKRSEAAAILLRMFEPSARKSFTLK